MEATTIVLQIKKSERGFFEQTASSSQLDFTCFESRGIDGTHEVLSILLGLSATSIPAIVSVLNTLIKSKRQIKIIVGGIEVSGISEKNVVTILHRILQGEARLGGKNEPRKK